MDDDYDPLSHLSTTLSLLPRTLGRVGFSLPAGLSAAEQMKAFLDHMHDLLKKDQNPGTKRFDKCPGPISNSTEKEGDEARAKCPDGQKQDLKLESLEPVEMKPQSCTYSHANELGPNPESLKLEPDEIGNSTPEGQNWASSFKTVEPMQLERQPCRNSSTNELSHNPGRLEIKRLETRNSGQGLDRDFSFKSVQTMEVEPRSSISGHANKTSSSASNIMIERDDAGKDSYDDQNVDFNLKSVQPTDVVPRPSISSLANNTSSSPNNVVIERNETGRDNSEGQNVELNFKSVEPTIEKDIRGKNRSCPAGMVKNGQKPRRPGLGLEYNLSPFTLIPKCKKTKQVVPVDFTVLDHITDPDAVPKKVYELEAAVKEIERLGGEPKIIGERVFKPVNGDQPRKRRPGLGLQLPKFKLIPLPMRPPPVKPPTRSTNSLETTQVYCARACHNGAPTQSTNSVSEVKALSRSQNEDPSSTSYATKEAPAVKLRASSPLVRLLSVLKNFPENDEENAVAMVFEALNLNQTVIPPLVIPDMPIFSKSDVVRSPWRQPPSIERVREQRGEDPLVAFEELKRKFFVRTPTTHNSDADTNPLVGVGSPRSLSSSPGWPFSSENEEIGMPSHAGPSGSPNVEVEEFPSQQKVTSDARGDNDISDDDFAHIDIPDEFEMASPWENSPANIELPPSDTPLENSPVNKEAPPSDMPLENQPEEEVVPKEASRGKGKKRGLDHADSSVDIHSENPPLASDGYTETQAETNLVEPPRETDDQMPPPKKRNKNRRKTRSSIQIVEGGLQEVGGVRRSTRIRSKPLRHWMGERLLYASINDNFPGAVGVKECSPATAGMRVKVKSFVSDKHAEVIAWLAR